MAEAPAGRRREPNGGATGDGGTAPPPPRRIGSEAPAAGCSDSRSARGWRPRSTGRSIPSREPGPPRGAARPSPRRGRAGGGRRPYHVGGSFASSVHGTPRQTQDIDFVVEIDAGRAEVLVTALREAFYADAAAAREAAARRESFNLIHLDSGIKVALFVRGEAPFDLAEFERRRPETRLPVLVGRATGNRGVRRACAGGLRRRESNPPPGILRSCRGTTG